MNVGMISIFPPPNEKHAKLGGVGSYTKNLVESMKNDCSNIIIFSNKLETQSSEYNKDGVDVFYCWDIGSMRYPFQIYNRYIKQKKQIDIFHVQYEVFLYGGIFSAITFPLLLLLLRLQGITILTTLHAVIPLSKFDNEYLDTLGINGPPQLLKIILKIYTQVISFLSSRLIVHDPPFKTWLLDEYGCKNAEDIHVIPHGVENKINALHLDDAKETLKIQDKKVVLFFGYISKYKGIELLIDSFKLLKQDDFILIIAGGDHPRFKNDPEYKEYVLSLKNKALESPNEIIFTGFVPEDKIQYYFSAADLVIFPYSEVMSSSGPMALSIAYEKPFLSSSSYKDILIDDVIFEKKPEILAKMIYAFFQNKEMLMNVRSYVQDLKSKRAWPAIGKKHLRLYRSSIENRSNRKII